MTACYAVGVYCMQEAAPLSPPISHCHIMVMGLFVVHCSSRCLVWQLYGTLINRRCQWVEWEREKIGYCHPPSPRNHHHHERTLPFFIRPSVNRLSLNDGYEWQWSIAITSRIGREHLLIDPGVMEWMEGIDSIGYEMRGEDVRLTWEVHYNLHSYFIIASHVSALHFQSYFGGEVTVHSNGMCR